MPTTNTTLKYPFGTTPTEVIREQVRRGAESSISLTDVSRTARLDLNADDLLTMLDALEVASVRSVDVNIRGRSYQLRIEILAALGIDEGGE